MHILYIIGLEVTLRYVDHWREKELNSTPNSQTRSRLLEFTVKLFFYQEMLNPWTPFYANGAFKLKFFILWAPMELRDICTHFM